MMRKENELPQDTQGITHPCLCKPSLFFIYHLCVCVYVFTDDIWYWRSENTRTHIHTIKAFHFKFII